MKYSDGEPVRLGDTVDLGGGMTGIVVALISTGEFSKNYPAAEWNYLEVGALVNSREGGLMHYINTENDFSLIARD